MNPLPSIHHNIEPLEHGGVISRNGFLFQDHVAAKWCLEMIIDSSLIEVRCESQDDITLLWLENGDQYVEFIQVKSNTFDQLWSIAKLCEKEIKYGTNQTGSSVAKSGLSILEKLIANDRFSESARFRIVTSRDVNDELSILRDPTSSPSRSIFTAKFQSLCDQLRRRIQMDKSPKGTGIVDLINQTTWDVEHEIDALQAKSCNKLHVCVERRGTYLPSAQIMAIYEALLMKVQRVACADWRTNSEAKKIKREDFIRWLDKEIQQIRPHISQGVIEVLEEKMHDAKLPNESIFAAIDAIEAYREELFSSKYFEPSDRRHIDHEVQAELHQLLSKLDSGKLSLSNLEFHNLCLSRLEEIKDNLSIELRPIKSYLHGCMYFITGRCGHRFRKLES